MSDGTPIVGTYTDGYVDALDAALDFIVEAIQFSDNGDEMEKLVRAIVRQLWPKRVPVPGAYKF